MARLPLLQSRDAQHGAARQHLDANNMRAPGESFGAFALETAMDRLAEMVGLDPVELRLRNPPTTHPEDGTPLSTNALRECLLDGAAAFGWAGRPATATGREGLELVGFGMAAGCYGAYCSQAAVHHSFRRRHDRGGERPLSAKLQKKR